MFELLPTDMLQHGSGPFGAMLATWLIWPILCGYIGARKGELRRGIMNGLFWGPIGLAFILLMEREYACPTCGQKTLKKPYAADTRPAVVLSGPPPKARALPKPVMAAERRAPSPMNKEEREKIVVAACAGYDAEEEARLRSWLNND